MREIEREELEPLATGAWMLADDDMVALVAGVGAPLVGLERLSDPRFPLRAMEKRLGARFRAVMSGEIGGANGLRSLMVAGVTGLPVVDADSMGRAFGVRLGHRLCWEHGTRGAVYCAVSAARAPRSRRPCYSATLRGGTSMGQKRRTHKSWPAVAALVGSRSDTWQRPSTT